MKTAQDLRQTATTRQRQLLENLKRGVHLATRLDLNNLNYRDVESLRSTTELICQYFHEFVAYSNALLTGDAPLPTPPKGNDVTVTIFECLQNANYNLQNNSGIGLMMAKPQLNNAVVLLGKGYSPGRMVEPLLEKYGSVEKVPEFIDLPDDEQKAE